MLFMTHRQAWCWQDEYADLSIDEVRQLEAETQEILNDKMRENKNGVNNRSIKKSSSKSSLTTSNSKSSKDKCKILIHLILPFQRLNCVFSNSSFRYISKCNNELSIVTQSTK